MNYKIAVINILIYIGLIDNKLDKDEQKVLHDMLDSISCDVYPSDLDNILNKRDKASVKDIGYMYKDAVKYMIDYTSDTQKQQLLISAYNISNGDYISRTIESEIYEELDNLLSTNINFDEYFEYIEQELIDN